jgi:hypothetical protein
VGTLLTFAVYALATVSAARLIIDDEIVRDARNWWLSHTRTGTLARYWISCIWCVSMATAVLPSAAWVLAPENPWFKIPAAVLAFRWMAVKMYTWQALLQGKAALYAPPPADEQEAR